MKHHRGQQKWGFFWGGVIKHLAKSRTFQGGRSVIV